VTAELGGAPALRHQGGTTTVEVEPDLHDRPRERATRHGLGLEEEAPSLPRAARDAAERREEQARWTAPFALTVELPADAPTSTGVVRQMQDER
jgi:hypothetical protein